MNITLRIITSILCLFVGIISAQAADLIGGKPILERSFKNLEPLGIRIGKMLVFPSLETKIHYSSNVLKSSKNEISDKFYSLKPEISGILENNDSKTSFSLNAERLKYDKTNSQDRTNFDLSISNAYKFSSKTTLKTVISAIRSHQTRFEANIDNIIDDPIKIDEHGFFTQLIYKPSRWSFLTDFTYKDYKHKDIGNPNNGGTIVQKDRNREIYSIGQIVQYDRSTASRFLPFIGFRASKINYEHRNFISGSGFTGVNQDRNRFSTTVGVEIKPGSKLQGHAKIGYSFEKTKDSNLDSTDTALIDIDLTYLYSPLTNFIFEFDRFFSDDTNSSQGIIKTELSAKIIHELTRQWILSAGIKYIDRSFENRQNDDQSWVGLLGFDYKVNRNISIGGDLEYISRESNQSNGDYDEGKAMVRLKTSF